MNATLDLEFVHDPSVVAKVTEDEMLRHLRFNYTRNGWAAIPQVTVAPADLDPSAVNAVPFDGPEPPSTGADRRIDMLMIRRSRNPERTGPVHTLAIEVKVTRADFLSDVRNPAKQQAWRDAATQHAYAVPAGLVQAHEVPEGSGLLWVSPPPHQYADPKIETVVRAPYQPGHRPALPLRVVIALLFRLAVYDAQVRGWQGRVEAPAESEEELRAALAAARRRADKLSRELDTATSKAEAWRKAYTLAASDGLPCGICGRPVKPIRPNARSWFGEWRHLDRADDTPCELAEQAQAEEDARAAYDEAPTQERERRLRTAHARGFVPEIEAEPWRAFLRPATEPVRPGPEFPPDPPIESRAGQPAQRGRT